MNITVMGNGYVGLVTGATLSDAENKVTSLDLIESKIDVIHSYLIPSECLSDW